MEVKGTGFGAANNVPAVVVDIAALTLTVNRTLETEVAAAGRALTVGQPSEVARENVRFEPTQGVPHFEEQFLPGPNIQETVGEGGTIKAEPMLVILIHVPEGVGIGATNGYRDNLLALLKPMTVMTLTNGDFLRVRTTPAPWSDQTLHRKTGWATTPVSFPLRLFTINS